VVTCALANKLARIAWALTARQQTYVGKVRISHQTQKNAYVSD
ncbi:hypothetical protein, partial [Klebsiella pneumoniae]